MKAIPLHLPSPQTDGTELTAASYPSYVRKALRRVTYGHRDDATRQSPTENERHGLHLEIAAERLEETEKARRWISEAGARHVEALRVYH